MAKIRRRRITTKTTPGLEDLPRAALLPGHIRKDEWNGIKHLQPCLVSPITRKGSHYIFLYHVTAPDGAEYIEVLEQAVFRSNRSANKDGPRKIRSLDPSRVYPLPLKIRRRLEAKETA